MADPAMKPPEQAPRVERMSESEFEAMLADCDIGYAEEPLVAECRRARAAEEDLRHDYEMTKVDWHAAQRHGDQLREECKQLRADLAASRAREAELAEALGHAMVDDCHFSWATISCNEHSCPPWHELARALLAAGAKEKP